MLPGRAPFKFVAVLFALLWRTHLDEEVFGRCLFGNCFFQANEKYWIFLVGINPALSISEPELFFSVGFWQAVFQQPAGGNPLLLGDVAHAA